MGGFSSSSFAVAAFSIAAFSFNVAQVQPLAPVIATDLGGMGFEGHDRWLQDMQARRHREEEAVLLAVMNFVLEQS